jgi:hypothetical protein
MTLTTKPEVETSAHKMIVSIASQNPEFAKKLSEHLRADKNFSIMRNPTAIDVAGRMKNIIFATEHALGVNADCVISVNCSDPKYWEDYKPPKEEGGHKLYVNVLSKQLLVVSALCKDKACVEKFPGEVEKEILQLIEEFAATEGTKRVPLKSLSQEILNEKRESSAASHWLRKVMRDMSRGKVFVEILIPLKKDEDAAQAAEDCATIIDRLCKFNAAKNKAVLEDSRLLLK